MGIAGVAGLNLPAFVERWSFDVRSATNAPGVAGLNLPAFVERLPSIMR